MSVWHFNWICAYAIEPHLSVCPIRWFKKTSTVLHDAHWANCSYALEQLYPLSLYIQIFLLASFVILIFWYFDILIIVRKWIFGYKLDIKILSFVSVWCVWSAVNIRQFLSNIQIHSYRSQKVVFELEKKSAWTHNKWSLDYQNPSARRQNQYSVCPPTDWTETTRPWQAELIIRVVSPCWPISRTSATNSRTMETRCSDANEQHRQTYTKVIMNRRVRRCDAVVRPATFKLKMWWDLHPERLVQTCQPYHHFRARNSRDRPQHWQNQPDCQNRLQRLLRRVHWSSRTLRWHLALPRVQLARLVRYRK